MRILARRGKPLIEYPVSVIYKKTESGDSTVTFSTEEEMVSDKISMCRAVG